VTIVGTWGLQFGNGESLGESNRLYFAAGPEDESAGLFGRLSAVPEPPSATLMLLGLGLVGVIARG
jgi:PEP-CTERM motif